MKANDIYKLPEDPDMREINRVPANSLYILQGFSYDHVPEFRDQVSSIVPEYNTKITMKIHKEFDYDHRRFWRLASVWFEGNPVMIIQNAGREADDCARRYITDAIRFREMIMYLYSLPQYGQVDDALKDVIDPDEDRDDLDTFYGQSLQGPFERHKY